MPLLQSLALIPALRHCCAAMSVALCLSACAELPKDVVRPESVALASPAGTPLATLVQQRHDQAAARYESGFVLLDGPQSAYGSRLALVEKAQKTLDLQYYTIHADPSTARLLAAVREAAGRGVRVRILLDDLHSSGDDAVVMEMAFVPNIEMRMFNPLAGARASSIGRMLGSLDDASRAQQRMHNKLFIADNVMAVSGGRNLGDAYFGKASDGNFIDLDLLVAGPAVQDLSRSFDSYWNNQRAYPVQSLVSREELDKIRAKARADAAAKRAKEASASADGRTEGNARSAAAPSAAGPAGAASTADDGAQASKEAVPGVDPRQGAWDMKPMDLANADFTWAPAAVLADKPAKIAPDDATRGTASSGKAPGLVVTKVSARSEPSSAAARPAAENASLDASAPPRSLSAAANLAASGDTVVDGLLQLVGQAQHDLLIISPYFVPGPEMEHAFAEARSRGVRIRVLTNSLASNDAPVAHVGYARHREELLAMGIELYELRSDQAGLVSAFGAGSSGNVSGQSRSMLHSKVLVLDNRLLVVGSMNLDQRSQLQNTEIAVLIRSDALSKTATDKIEKVLDTGAWHVEEQGGALVWHAPAGSGLADSRTEPDSSAGLRLLLKVFGPLAPDSLL